MLWLLLACSTGQKPQVLNTGEWSFEGEDYAGELRVEGQDCLINLWGPHFRAGSEEVPCQSIQDEGRIGIHFSVEMGAGEAMAYAWTTADMAELTLPLGSREGDLEEVLQMRTGSLDPLVRKTAQERSESGLLASREMWARSVFRLEDSGRLVGELFLPEERPAELQLYGARWMTRGRVVAELGERGPDLWLNFEIMPSLESERGLMLVNRATNQVVFPLGELPVPGEIVLDLVDGAVLEEERAASIATAMDEGSQREQQVTGPIAQALWALATEQGCPQWPTLETAHPEFSVGLQGYAVSTQKEKDNCQVLVEPRPVQQGRRVSFRVSKGAGLEAVERRFSLD